MNIRTLLLMISTTMLVACASISEIELAGKDTYVVSGENDSIFRHRSGVGIKSVLYKRANAHCEKMGKKLLPLKETVGNYSAHLRFRCLNANDPARRKDENNKNH